MTKPLLLSVVFLAFLSACAGMKPEAYRLTEPRLDLFEFFSGQTRAWGMFQDRFGNLKRRFVVDIQGTVQGEELLLEEHFRYDDGEQQERIWRIRRLDENHFSGTAADVVGEAQGVAYGAALNWKYELRLQVGDGVWQVHFDDWMYQLDGDTLVNRAEVRKLGLRLGEVTLFFRKQPWTGAESAKRG